MKHIVYYCLFLGLVLTACRTSPKYSAGAPGAQPPGAAPTVPQQQAQQPVVLVRGDVKNTVIPWTEDLTLAQAIDAAQYRSAFDPRTILLVRQGQTHRIEPKQLLQGRENPALEPGDIIELR